MPSSNLDKFLASILAINELIRNDPAFKADPAAQVLANKIGSNVDSLTKMVAPVPKQRVLVMPEPSDKNTFVLEAMADAMGLRIVEAEVPPVEVKKDPITPEGEFRDELFVEEVKKVLNVSPSPAIEPTHELINGQWVEKRTGEVAVPKGVVISKKTGKPKRAYVRSGKFTAEERAKKGYRKLRKS